MGAAKFGDFSGGEISPNVYGNSLLELNQTGCRQLLNCWTTSTGAVIKRQGSEWLGFGPVYGKRPRLVPFRFSTVQAYQLVFQENIAFIMKDGGFVLNPQTDIESSGTSIQSLGTGELRVNVGGTTAGVHGLAVGDIVYATSVSPAGYEAVRRRYFKVSSIVSTSIFLMVERDGTNPALGAIAVQSGFEYKKLASFAIPYSEADLHDGTLDWDQSANQLFVFHSKHRTRIVTRTDHHVWTVDNFIATPEEPTVTGLTDTASPSSTLSIKYAVTAINDTSGEESLAAILVIDNTDEPTEADPVELQWDKNANAEVYRVYRAINGIFGLLDEARWVSGATVTFVDKGLRTPLLEIGPPIEVETEFASAGDYPRTGNLFAQRIWLGGTENDVNGVFASRSGSFRSFAVEEVVVDSSPIAQIVASNGVQAIRYLLSIQDMVIFTEDGEWTFDKGDKGIITPGSGLRSESDWGCANVRPIKIGKGAVFVEKSGKIVRDIGYDVSADGLNGIDLTAAVDHLFEDAKIIRWCYARKPNKILFCVLSNGKAVSLGYDREQQKFGWARHYTAGSFDDAISVSEDESDNIYISVLRNGDYCIERIKTKITHRDQDGVYLDSWYKRPIDQISGYKSAAIVEIREDTDDGWKWKVNISGDEVEHWPAIIDLNASAASIFPHIDGGSIMLVSDPNPPGAGNWYTLNRFSGAAPTWSTETATTSGLTLHPLVTPKGSRGTAAYYRFATLCGSIYYGTGEIRHVRGMAPVSGPYGQISPRFRLDDTHYEFPGPGATPEQITDLNGDKAYASVVIGYPYTAILETMEINPADVPLDGAHVRTPVVAFRVTDCMDFYYRRSSQDRRDSIVHVVSKAKDRYDALRGLVRNAAISVALHSKWDTQSSVMVISPDPYPITIQAISIEAQAGDQ